ncbi:GIY-YIG nuclease family protein [Streptomyces sp. NPDC004838]
MHEDNCGRLDRCLNPFHNHGGGIDRLSRLVDPADPAFDAIATVLTEMSDAGVDFTAEVVQIAITLGRHRHRQDHLPQRLAPSTSRGNRTAGPVVYYIRRGNLIKVGTTVNLRDRMNVLMPDEVLAVEPGGRDVESQRHRQFRELRTSSRGEYFFPGKALQQHVRSVRAQHGTPDPTLPTMGHASLSWAADLAESAECR